MGWTGATAGFDFDADSGTSIVVTAPQHPLAAGLSGTVTVFSATMELAWARPGPAAVVVAAMPGDATKATVFGYPTGAPTPGGRARAARVGLFASWLHVHTLTNAGVRLLDAAVAWAWAN